MNERVHIRERGTGGFNGSFFSKEASRCVCLDYYEWTRQTGRRTRQIFRLAGMGKAFSIGEYHFLYFMGGYLYGFFMLVVTLGTLIYCD